MADRKNVYVISASKWSMTGDNGQPASGVTVQCALTDTLVPVAETENLRGYKVVKASLPFNEFENFTVVPAVYSAEESLSINSAGNVSLRLTNFKFERKLEMAAPFDEKKAK